MPGHTKCCTCHAKSSQQTWRSEAPKWNPSEEISALTSWHLWWTCLLYCAGHAKCIFADPLQMSHACQCFWNCYKTLTFCSLFTRCTIPCAYHAKWHLNVQKYSRNLQFCALLTSKCASRHNGVHFFDISTSKSGPTLRCFVHFDFEMCFAPQRRALFRHLNFQKWSGAEVFCTFWPRNMLRATTACTFSASQLPKVVREWCALYILTSKCTSRHNGVQFFISHLASWLRTLASLLFDLRSHKSLERHSVSRLFLPFRASASSFFWLFLFSDLLSSNLSLLSASALLCFSSVHIVGSLTSKLPSTTAHNCTKLCNFMKIK